MRKIMSRLWSDDGGALIATEWLFLATIMVIGLTVGLVTVRNYVVAELEEFGQAVGALDQSYSYYALTSNDDTNFSNGSTALDTNPDQRGATGTHGSPFITSEAQTSTRSATIDATPGF